MENSPEFKSMLVHLIERSIQLIRRTIPYNPQYAYELSDAIHNMAGWIDNPDAYILKHQMFHALAMLLDKERQQEVNKNFIGRDGLGRYEKLMFNMDYAVKDGKFEGIYINDELYKSPQTCSNLGVL